MHVQDYSGQVTPPTAYTYRTANDTHNRQAATYQREDAEELQAGPFEAGTTNPTEPQPETCTVSLNSKPPTRKI